MSCNDCGYHPCSLHEAAEELLRELEYFVDKAFKYKAITHADIVRATALINKAKEEPS